MTPPYRARYGVKDNSHALLEWRGPGDAPPSELLGLTDKPPGSYAPGDRWWPSVGCGPVGCWWALWWTDPDREAKRGGMARSEVALWDLSDIGSLDDLGPILSELSGNEQVASPSAELLGALAEALLESTGSIPVVIGLESWPGLISDLWRRLWPQARIEFSARVAVSPPQGGGSVAPPWMFGVPSERVAQWSAQRTIVPPSHPVQLSRAASWWVRGDDSTFEEVLAAAHLTGDIGRLRRISRAADRLDALRTTPSAASAVELLRTVFALGPEPADMVQLKTEALHTLDEMLAAAPSEPGFALANLEPARLPAGQVPTQPMKAWTRTHVPNLDLEQTDRLLSLLAPGRAEHWWQRAVEGQLVDMFATPNRRWAEVALRWLSRSTANGVLQRIIPATVAMERQLLSAADEVVLSHIALSRLLLEASERGWSCLHGLGLMKGYLPGEALKRQRGFSGDPVPGLTLLINRLPGADVVSDAVACVDDVHSNLVARRTVRDPTLLSLLDATDPGWRCLWQAHIRAGGDPWPPECDRPGLATVLLDLILAGEECEALMLVLAGDLAPFVVQHPARAKLWIALSREERAVLLGPVAAEVVRICDAGGTVAVQESEVMTAVVQQARSSTPSARLVALMLQWDVPINEGEFIEWLRGHRGSDWLPVADAIGHSVLRRNWNAAAKELYRRSKLTQELRPAALAVRDLLSSWQRWRLGYETEDGSPPQMLAHRVAALGADLAPEGLEGLWERAGGERKRLAWRSTPDGRWREAAQMAQKGALDRGLAALVDVLLIDFPHNVDLQELGGILGRKVEGALR